MDSDYIEPIRNIFNIQGEIQDLHPLLERLFPIAVVEDGKFLIYDLNSARADYQFIKAVPLPMPVPDKVRAAFDLQAYGNRIACVITRDIFEEPAGYATIFHEFVHCSQAEICEIALKQELRVCQKAMAVQDYMWEINHPFPYDDPVFVEAYRTLLNTDSLETIDQIHDQLKDHLDLEDYEYLVWQEWKEGLARFIENLIRQRLGYEIRQWGENIAFNRVAFYEGGANYISTLTSQQPDLRTDIEGLFYRMSERPIK